MAPTHNKAMVHSPSKVGLDLHSAASLLHFGRTSRRYCDTKSHDILLNNSQEAVLFHHGMVLPVPEPGGRCWQRRGLKHSVRDRQ